MQHTRRSKASVLISWMARRASGDGAQAQHAFTLFGCGNANHDVRFRLAQHVFDGLPHRRSGIAMLPVRTHDNEGGILLACRRYDGGAGLTISDRSEEHTSEL